MSIRPSVCGATKASNVGTAASADVKGRLHHVLSAGQTSNKTPTPGSIKRVENVESFLDGLHNLSLEDTTTKGGGRSSPDVSIELEIVDVNAMKNKATQDAENVAKNWEQDAYPDMEEKDFVKQLRWIKEVKIANEKQIAKGELASLRLAKEVEEKEDDDVARTDRAYASAMAKVTFYETLADILAELVLKYDMVPMERQSSERYYFREGQRYNLNDGTSASAAGVAFRAKATSKIAAALARF